MAASRCPNCDTPLTAAETAAGVCPDCAAALMSEPLPTAAPAAPTPVPWARPSRWRFFAGVAVGILLAAAAAAGAWWAWGPFPIPPAAAAAAPSPEPRAVAAQSAAEDLTRPAETVELARVAAERAGADRAATEEALAGARDRLQATLCEVAAAEAERTAAEARLRAVQGKEAEPAIAKARAAVRQADAQRAAAERALADANARLRGARAKEEQARQAETAARNARADAERALGDARNRLQAVNNQHADADRQLAATRARLQATKDQSAAADRELTEKRARLADLDRTIQAKGAKAATRPAPAPITKLKPSTGFVRDWLVVGPFPAPDRKGHGIAFPPEGDRVDPKKEYKAAAGTLRWRTYASPADYVDFADLFKTKDPAVAYAVCWVHADRARQLWLSLGSNDGIKVWVGGKAVADVGVFRSAAPGQDKVSSDLAAGWNEVRVKVDNHGGPWGFYFEIRDPATDKPATGLEFTTTPPDAKGRK